MFFFRQKYCDASNYFFCGNAHTFKAARVIESETLRSGRGEVATTSMMKRWSKVLFPFSSYQSKVVLLCSRVGWGVDKKGFFWERNCGKFRGISPEKRLSFPSMNLGVLWSNFKKILQFLTCVPFIIKPPSCCDKWHFFVASIIILGSMMPPGQWAPLPGPKKAIMLWKWAKKDLCYQQEAH